MEKVKTYTGDLEDEVHIAGVNIGPDLSATVNYRLITVRGEDKIGMPWPKKVSVIGPVQISLNPLQTVAILETGSTAADKVEALHQLRRDKRDEALGAEAKEEES